MENVKAMGCWYFLPLYSVVQNTEGSSVIQKHPSTSCGRRGSPGYFFSMVALFCTPCLTDSALMTEKKERKEGKIEGRKRHRKKKKREKENMTKIIYFPKSLKAWGHNTLFYFRTSRTSANGPGHVCTGQRGSTYVFPNQAQ